VTVIFGEADSEMFSGRWVTIGGAGGHLSDEDFSLTWIGSGRTTPATFRRSISDPLFSSEAPLRVLEKTDRRPEPAREEISVCSGSAAGTSSLFTGRAVTGRAGQFPKSGCPGPPRQGTISSPATEGPAVLPGARSSRWRSRCCSRRSPVWCPQHRNGCRPE